MQYEREFVLSAEYAFLLRGSQPPALQLPISQVGSRSLEDVRLPRVGSEAKRNLVDPSFSFMSGEIPEARVSVTFTVEACLSRGIEGKYGVSNFPLAA